MAFWIHPLIQVVATLLSFYVLHLGWQRVQCSHLGQKTVFAWKQHVLFGRWAIGLWLVGGLVGLAVVRFGWGAFLLTNTHAQVGYTFMVLALFGYLSGHVMDKVKKRRTLLPIIHGCVNSLLVLAALWQAWTGFPFLP